MSQKRTNRKLDVRALALAGILCGVVGVMTLVPQLGYVTIPALQISITTLHIPVIIGAALLGPAWGAAVGGFWGITCLVKAFVAPTGVLDYLFQNPLYSVLPRILVGVAGAYAYRLFRRLLGNGKGYWAYYLSGVVGALTNTVLVLGFLILFSAEARNVLGDSLVTVFTLILTVNGALEILVAPFLIAAAASAADRAWKFSG